MWHYISYQDCGSIARSLIQQPISVGQFFNKIIKQRSQPISFLVKSLSRVTSSLVYQVDSITYSPKRHAAQIANGQN